MTLGSIKSLQLTAQAFAQSAAPLSTDPQVKKSGDPKKDSYVSTPIGLGSVMGGGSNGPASRRESWARGVRSELSRYIKTLEENQHDEYDPATLRLIDSFFNPLVENTELRQEVFRPSHDDQSDGDLLDEIKAVKYLIRITAVETMANVDIDISALKQLIDLGDSGARKLTVNEIWDVFDTRRVSIDQKQLNLTLPGREARVIVLKAPGGYEAIPDRLPTLHMSPDGSSVVRANIPPILEHPKTDNPLPLQHDLPSQGPESIVNLFFRHPEIWTILPLSTQQTFQRAAAIARNSGRALVQGVARYAPIKMEVGALATWAALRSFFLMPVFIPQGFFNEMSQMNQPVKEGI